MKLLGSTLLFLVFAIIISITITNIPMSFSQTVDNPQLFTPIAIGATSNIQIPASDTITQTRIVQVNMNALQAEQIDVTLFGHTITISKDRVTTNDDYYAWFGSGDNINAVIVVDGMELAGLISTNNGTYGILATDLESVHILLDVDTSQLPPEEGNQDSSTSSGAVSGQSHIASSSQALITQLENAYIGGRDYSDDKITIDVYVAYTSAVDDNTNLGHRNPGAAARLAVELANDSYNDNHLPLTLNLVDTGEVRGYTETTMSTTTNTAISMALTDITNTGNSLFNRVRAEAVNENADVVVFFVSPDENSCGQAKDILPDSVSSFYAVVGYDCISKHTFAHEIGHLQGAGHNKDFSSFGNPTYTNSEFSYGHGYYELPSSPIIDSDSIKGKGTIMSYDCDNDRTIQSCTRNGIWSDPHDSFIGSANPVGTESNNWNAKVLFATGPYVASLRGSEQNYDSIRPSGTISLPVTTIIRGALLDITATFDEDIHDKYPPRITITDGTTLTISEMTKSTNKIYTLAHTLSDEIGTVNVSFSNARDIYGNIIVATPTSGDTFTVINEDHPPIISAFPDIILDISTTRIITVTASDPDGNPITLTVSGASFATISGSIVTLSPGNSDAGTYTITITATANGKSDTESFNVTITNPASDIIPPILTIPNDKTFEATSIQTLLITSQIGTATATDNTDPNPTITNNATSAFPIGTTTVTWTVTDDAGNSDSADQRITIQDTTPPQFTTTLQDMTITTDNNSAVVSFDIPTATDIFPVTVSCDHSSGASFSIGTTLVTCTATDSNSNSIVTSSTFTVTQSDSAQTSVIDDSFNSTLDSWTFQEKPNAVANQRYCNTQNTNVYSLAHNSNHGGSALVDYSNTCWFGMAGGVKSFTVPTVHDGSTLEMTLDYRSVARAIFAGIGHVNNMFVLITDSDDNVIKQETLYSGARSSSLRDTNWQEKTITVNAINATKCPCDVFVYTSDSWSAEWQKKIYFDDVNVTLSRPMFDTSDTSNSFDVKIPPNTLKQDELFEMMYANNTKVIINTKQVHDNSILIKWDIFDDASRYYKVVIALSSDPRDKSGYIVNNNTEYRFINLVPDTQYDVAVGLRGDDTTQSILKIRTTPDGMMHFDSRLVLDAQIKQDSETISLSWIDSNSVGENLYMIERSVDNGIFELTALNPRYDTSIDDEINSEWYGKTISYKIFERIGEQKLFSNEITVAIPAQ